MNLGFAISFGNDKGEECLTFNQVTGKSRTNIQLTDNTTFQNPSSHRRRVGDYVRNTIQAVTSHAGDRVPLVFGVHNRIFAAQNSGDISDLTQAIFEYFVPGKIFREELLDIHFATFYNDNCKNDGEKISKIGFDIGDIPDVSLDEFKKRAFEDGKMVMQESMDSIGVQAFSNFRFVRFGRRDHPRYTYLHAYSCLKDVFVQGMMSLRPPGSTKHHVCVKTAKDKSAPPLVDIVTTHIADILQKKIKRIGYGHVQTLLP